MSELPSGWATATLGTLAEFKYGKALPASTRDGGNFPVFGSNGIIGYHSEWLSAAPTIVIGRKGSVGEICFSDKNCSPIDTTYYVDDFATFDPKFFFYLLKTLSLENLNRSTAIPGLNRQDAYNLTIQVPPLAEQTRIAQKLDELLAQVDTLKARIEAIPTLLKRFRQSVLATAVTGQLTEKWRTLNDAESVENYIQKIRSKRVEAWQETQENSQRKSQYKAPDALLDENFPELPESWAYCSLSEVTSRVTYGLTVRPSYVEIGAPVISAKEIKSGVVDYENANKISFADYELQREKCKIFQGDVLFGKTGTIGSVARADKEIQCCSSQNIAVISPLINSKFLEIVLRSRLIQNLATRNIKTTAIPDLQLGVISRFPVPLSSEKEQIEIVRRVEQLFAFADQLEAKVASAKSRIDLLARSVLAKAFRGELVQQDPSDEPASVMLQNIKDQRAAATKATRGRKSI
ncbi:MULTISPECIES: restriction endonuclease subunit S [Pseudomonas]|uniref:Restriction endonuclease subunit S n=1 Tax=Pseudomonas reactans TaxID=117680 RepID=A0A7Y8FXV3_9PSED|nr:restriction endonuclease subunit S [Pseudomonas reactans]NWE87348.1 restriction endonuclease subunit S [Pseudomonas reactans]